jgi:hypothetical protein
MATAQKENRKTK